MINVNCKVNVYEIESKEVPITQASVKVFSHWNNPKFIMIQINDDPPHTVIAMDLIAAIENSQNINRF